MTQIFQSVGFVKNSTRSSPKSLQNSEMAGAVHVSLVYGNRTCTLTTVRLATLKKVHQTALGKVKVNVKLYSALS